MKDHHIRLLQTGDMTIYPIVYDQACFGVNGYPLAVSIFMMYCSSAYKIQSLTIPFSIHEYMKIGMCSKQTILKSNQALLEYKCIEFVNGEDKRRKYIKILA